MNILELELNTSLAIGVAVTDNTLIVELNDVRTISVPIEWFPRLAYATITERNNWRLIGRGHGIHWEDIDEDISVEGVLLGKKSNEAQSSFEKWPNHRKIILHSR
ncbi:MAG: DUF2442 domain-containing protein [Nitrospirae bacterium]|nr:DUF2442 domain-containing protein [Nitrospirota bacterium]